MRERKGKKERRQIVRADLCVLINSRAGGGWLGLPALASSALRRRLRTHPTAHNSAFLFCFGFLPPACLNTPGRNGEEAIPMLMLNHSDKPDGARPGPPRPQPLQPFVDRSPPRLVEITSHPGSPPKLTELKAAGKYAPSLLSHRLPLPPSCQSYLYLSVG